MNGPRPLHRLFGLTWIDFFDGTNVSVETEVDLSLKQQFLDLVIIRKGGEPIARRLPDGFENLGNYNLVTFKSFQEALDAWALCELVGHYVNYRKQVSPSMQNLLGEDQFRLFAVCTRFPQGLAAQMTLTPVGNGVYEVKELALTIRIIVVNELPKESQNAMLLLFSAKEDLVRYGQDHYHPHSSETSSLLYHLYRAYSEDPKMSEKMKQFVRETFTEILGKLSPEERLKGLPAEERLKGLPAEERLKGLPAEERLKGLPAEERLKGLSTEEVLKALSPEVLAAIARELNKNQPAKPS